ncbi:hypothetical protein Zm00014a_006306 [Zea mays]|uniref:Uncharacterized protein n=1 Tax=Zea mays TaxID=4577 RepID=A0A3L6DWS5_MAIZE|nr:hypothetical protein Zm00014a_006306 [Zea mays]
MGMLRQFLMMIQLTNQMADLRSSEAKLFIKMALFRLVVWHVMMASNHQGSGLLEKAKEEFGSHFDDYFQILGVVCISFCSEKETYLSGSLDHTVLLWDQRAEKSQVLECHRNLHYSPYSAGNYNSHARVPACIYMVHYQACKVAFLLLL